MQRVYDLLKTPEVLVNLGRTDDTVVWKDPDIWKTPEQSKFKKISSNTIVIDFFLD